MMVLGQRREKEALNHRNVVRSVHAQHELRGGGRLKIRLASSGWNWIGSERYRWSHGLKSFSTSALLSLWGTVESGVSCRVLGAGQHLHLFSTVSGLEKHFEEKPVKRAQNLYSRKGQGRGADPL